MADQPDVKGNRRAAAFSALAPAAVGVALAICVPASAQTIPTSTTGSTLLNPDVRHGNVPWRLIDQGWEDIDPLARSLFHARPDLRSATGFGDVFDLGDGRFARVDGGLVAVFPRSTYAGTVTGLVPTIPPGTVFYIGTPAPAAAERRDPFRPPPGSTFAGHAVGRPPEATPASLRAENLFAGRRAGGAGESIPTHVPVEAT
ncbi:MAG: hypothetical protein KDA05_04995, partial [Phycisphaerales bacterium]|nr:hypothetical protein [Phycisphaerales bacterium]